MVHGDDAVERSVARAHDDVDFLAPEVAAVAVVRVEAAYADARRGVARTGERAQRPFLNATTFCFCSPRPWTPSVTTSPALRYCGVGFMPMPTPGGVPVVITSPGSSVIYLDTSATNSATPKIIVRVLPVCLREPLTSSHMSRFC